MSRIDIYVGNGDEEKKRRSRGKWLLPLVAGLIAAYALGREKPAVPAPAPPPKPVVVVPVIPPPVVETAAPPPAVDTAPPPPARLAAGPVRIDFGDGPLTRGVPAQMATIRNEGGLPLPGVTASADRPFLITNGCAGELAPGSQCMIAVVFAPQQPGKFNGSLKIAAGGERAQIPLRGSVPRPREVVTPAPAPPPVVAEVAPPAPAPVQPQLPPPRTLCFQPGNLMFTTTRKQTVTLTNAEITPIRVVGIEPVNREGLALTGFEIETRRCLRVLNPGQQCKFTVRPSEAAIQRRDRMHLKVYYDDPVTGGRRAARFSSACGGGR